jgi:hypothetical protein
MKQARCPHCGTWSPVTWQSELPPGGYWWIKSAECPACERVVLVETECIFRDAPDALQPATSTNQYLEATHDMDVPPELSLIRRGIAGAFEADKRHEAEVQALTAERDKLRAALVQVEGAETQHGYVCLWCGGLLDVRAQARGHRRGCPRQAALGIVGAP